MADKNLEITVGGAFLSNFPKRLSYARASEASTLFINEPLHENPPYLHIRESEEGIFIAEDFDGKKQRFFHITSVVQKKTDLILELVAIAPGAKEIRTYTIYPYRDIDDTFVVIQNIPDMEEKPVKWAIPAEFNYRIEVLPEGYP